MKKTIYTLLFTFLAISVFSQREIETDTFPKSPVDTVVICKGGDSKAFHSDHECVGLETCKGKLETVTDVVAIEKFGRKACCICWDNVEDECVDDNPDAYQGRDYDEDYDDSPDEEIFVEDFLYWLDGGVYFLIGALVGSAILLSNEVYVGTTYSYLPPNISSLPKSTITPTLGVDVAFRKNIKKSAFEYGFSYQQYEWEDDRRFPTRRESRSSMMFHLSYLHELNQYFSSANKSGTKLKFYIGPTFRAGIVENSFEESEDQYGVGGTMVLSLPLGKRFHLDLRNELTSYSSEVKFGIRWLYQRKYPWQK